jgi:hypothetical protein
MDMTGESRAPEWRDQDCFDELLAGMAAAARSGGCTIVPLRISYVIPEPSPGRWVAITAGADRIHVERAERAGARRGRRPRYLRTIDGGRQ